MPPATATLVQLSKDFLKSSALASFSKTLDSTNLLKSKLNTLGFEMTRIRVSVAAIPTLSMEICPKIDCDWDGLDKLTELDTAQQGVVSVLNNLSDMRTLMKEKEYEISAIEFVIGATVPSVHVSFRPPNVSSHINNDGDNVLVTSLAHIW